MIVRKTVGGFGCAECNCVHRDVAISMCFDLEDQTNRSGVVWRSEEEKEGEEYEDIKWNLGTLLGMAGDQMYLSYVCVACELEDQMRVSLEAGL